MADQRARTIRGSCFGSLLGILLGGFAGWFLTAPPRPNAEELPAVQGSANPAAGLLLVVEPVSGLLDGIQVLMGIAFGSLLGAVIGASVGVAVATSESSGRPRES